MEEKLLPKTKKEFVRASQKEIDFVIENASSMQPPISLSRNDAEMIVLAEKEAIYSVLTRAIH